MGILNLNDVPPPFDDPAGGESGSHPNAPAGEPASRPAPTQTTKTTATGAVIPSHVDGSAPPPPAQPAESSLFDTSALTGPDPASSGAEPAPEPEPEAEAAAEADPVRTLELKPQIVEQISTVYDPEIPVNIYELGLIYDIGVSKDGLAVIKMTLTAPGCPAAVTLPAEVQGKVKSIEGVTNARVDLVWEPPWDKDRMSDAAKLQLGIFD